MRHLHAAVALCCMSLILCGCIRVTFTAAAARTTTRELYDELKASKSGCIERSNRSLECLLDAPVHRSRVRFLTGVRSVADVKILRSGRICAARSLGGVKCLGKDMIRAVELGNVSGQRAFLWDDGYCVQERNRRRVRCEWFSPTFEFDRRHFPESPRKRSFSGIPRGSVRMQRPY